MATAFIKQYERWEAAESVGALDLYQFISAVTFHLGSQPIVDHGFAWPGRMSCPMKF
jgi:hypothetical protein